MLALSKRTMKPKPRQKLNRRQDHLYPTLRFTPYAWAKLIFLRDLGPTEVGGFGISSCDDLLLVEDFVLIDQVCTAVTVEFDDDSVADYFEHQVQLGRRPDRFARIWIHTHPGSSPSPSCTDEATFKRCFGAPDWALMFIIARRGATYARLRCNVGPGISKQIAVEVDYTTEFAASNHDRWADQYQQSVTVYDPFAEDRRLSHRTINDSFWRDHSSQERDWEAIEWVNS